MGTKQSLIGEQYGFLTVIKQAPDIISSSGKSKYRAWLCKCKCGNEVVIKESLLKKETHLIKSCGCSKVTNPNYSGSKMSAEELFYWEELYDYVNYTVMGYEKSMLSDYMILRLKGMREKKFIQNTEQDINDIYPTKVILNTFKFCIMDIKNALRSNHFKNENNKFNYIMKIVENKLNTVCLRMKQNEKEKTLAELPNSIPSEIRINNFKQREKPKMNPRLKSIF